VEGTLIFETPGTFAGHRNNADLGRSGTHAVGLVPLHVALPTTTGALWKKEEGNVVSVREAHALEMPTEKPVWKRKRKRGHVLHSVQRPVHVDRHSTPSGRKVVTRCRGRLGIEVGQTHASGRNRRRGLVERTKRGSPRVTAALVREQVVRDA
jgi:hypothetical protein